MTRRTNKSCRDCHEPPAPGSVRCLEHKAIATRCSKPQCPNVVNARGLCSTHYAQERISEAPPCSIEDCDSPRKARGWCEKHYGRWLANGDPLVVRQAPNGSGTLIRGYRRTMRNGRRIGDHQWLMEEDLGRELLPGETVHHKNGVRADNRIENLELWVTYQPSGQRPEDLVEWAHEVLRRYG